MADTLENRECQMPCSLIYSMMEIPPNESAETIDVGKEKLWGLEYHSRYTVGSVTTLCNKEIFRMKRSGEQELTMMDEIVKSILAILF
jgi:hypothetical protein